MQVRTAQTELLKLDVPRLETDERHDERSCQQETKESQEELA